MLGRGRGERITSLSNSVVNLSTLQFQNDNGLKLSSGAAQSKACFAGGVALATTS